MTWVVIQCYHIIIHQIYYLPYIYQSYDLDIVWPMCYLYNTQVSLRLYKFRESETSLCLLGI